MRTWMVPVLAVVLAAPTPFEPGPAPAAHRTCRHPGGRPRHNVFRTPADSRLWSILSRAASQKVRCTHASFQPTASSRLAETLPTGPTRWWLTWTSCWRRCWTRHGKKVGGDVATLDSYRGHGTWLGSVGVALGGYHLLGGTQFVAERERIADVLTTALAAKDGAPISSYPFLTWSYDTTPALLAVHLDDRFTGQQRSGALLDAHLAWLAANGDPELGLPYSRQSPNTEPPRGCDLSLRIAFLAQMDRDVAMDLYAKYTEHFWVDNGMAGFREFPPGVDGPQDIDSGPLLGEIGLAATGNGIAAVRAAGDDARHDRLRFQLTGVPLMVLTANGQRLPAMGGARISTEYRTGFLYGDAALLNAAAWEDWGVARTVATQP